MAYPSCCASCGIYYSGLAGQGAQAHVTLLAQDGGTSSPWAPDYPGRLLDLGCKGCGAIVRWDYFAPEPGGRLGRGLQVLRGSVDGWLPGDSFARESGHHTALGPDRRDSKAGSTVKAVQA